MGFVLVCVCSSSLTRTVEISEEQGPLGIHVVLYCSSLSGRAQEIFRQAMRSSLVCLEVVPVFNKECFEKSVIGHLFISENPESSRWTKDPPPLKVKPVESSSGQQAEIQESNSSLESCSLASPLPIRLSLTPRSKSADSPLLKNGLGPSPLQNHNNKNGKRLSINLRKRS
ncbi:partitioning defective 3 homolog B-like [Carassius auratus]|uniref:Partitioning defective 3 homolog B-like n=1 Tax=Carassius auratus TaxID=7957 RepID=A0A6P6P6Z3_CARAU|nr:partitioning defective 3 homolog B-like [Carassius auratus]